jgi:hypothetical protein
MVISFPPVRSRTALQRHVSVFKAPIISTLAPGVGIA